MTFPLIEDIRMEVANKYGMIQPGQSNTQAVRAVFVIDPQRRGENHPVLSVVNGSQL